MKTDHTVRSARKMFETEKLKFGDINHIRARNLLELQAELLEYVNNHVDELGDCPECDGTGEREYYDSERGRDYTDVCDDCNGLGTFVFDDNITSTMTFGKLQDTFDTLIRKVNGGEYPD